jgi:phosphoribosyl-AMP cyclohydrolase / phosphoribosyl-ATP pyrophosphohydrolase
MPLSLVKRARCSMKMTMRPAETEKMNRVDTVANLDAIDFAKGNGQVTVVAQDAQTGAVLMVAYADREALEQTIATREMHYRSRTRGLWRKGATSGNVQRLVALYYDCDGDALIAKVNPAGPACHTGATSCFDEEAAPRDSLDRLEATIQLRAKPSSDGTTPSYTRRLLADPNLRLKKLGEEAVELALACAAGDRDRAIDESADLFYHMLVALRAVGAGLPELRAALEDRAR